MGGVIHGFRGRPFRFQSTVFIHFVVIARRRRIGSRSSLCHCDCWCGGSPQESSEGQGRTQVADGIRTWFSGLPSPTHGARRSTQNKTIRLKMWVVPSPGFDPLDELKGFRFCSDVCVGIFDTEGRGGTVPALSSCGWYFL